MIGATAVLAALVLSATRVLADATLYRWKDSQGNIVMSDRQPPAGTEFEAISTDSSVVRRVEGEAPPEQVKMEPRSEPKQSSPKPNRSIYEKNSDYCESARKNLEVIGQAPRIRMPDTEGEMRYITDDEREAEKQKNLEIIKLHCE